MACLELGLLSPDSMYELLKFHKWHCFFFSFMNTSKAFSTEPACFEVNYEVFSKNSLFCLIYLMLNVCFTCALP